MHKFVAALFAITAIAAPTFAHAACAKGGCNQTQITTPIRTTADTSNRNSSAKSGKLPYLKITMKHVTVSSVD
jgi:hypothetical protein